MEGFLVLESRKIEKLQQPVAERAEDTFQMRLGELRKLQTRQKGGSGLPKELPRLLPNVTRDIVGRLLAALGEAIIQIWRQQSLQNRPQLEIVC